MKLQTVMLACAATLLSAGCASPGERYYTLVSASAPVPPAPVSPARTLVVEPASVPEADNRPQLVLGVAPQQRTLLEQERWVEPLPEDLQRALAQSLSAALPEVGIRLAGDHGIAPDAPHLYVQVRRFDLGMDVGARLEAHWEIIAADKVKLQEGDFAAANPVGGVRRYAALVQAQAATVAALGQQVARAVSAASGP